MEYIVMSGDTMYKIADRYGVTLSELIAANPQLSNPDLIYPGQVINIPIAAPPDGEIPPVCPGDEMPPVFPGDEMPPDFPGSGMFPEFPDEGMMPEFPGGDMMPGFPGGGMVPGFPSGGMIPGFPGAGLMPGFPGGGMMPGFPGGGMMPGFPGGGMIPGFPGAGLMPGFPGGGMSPGYPGGGMMPGNPGIMGVNAPGGVQPEKYIAKPGDHGKHVAYLQGRLKELGYYKGTVTGRFGAKTKVAIKRLQQDCNMKKTGIVDRVVWNSIGKS